MKKLILSTVFLFCGRIAALEMDELLQSVSSLMQELQTVEVVLDNVIQQEHQQESGAQKEKAAAIGQLEAIITEYGLRDFSTLGNKALSSTTFDTYSKQLTALSNYATPEENASYSYIIARDFLEYIDQRFLTQLFSYVEAAKNKPLDIERQLNAFAKNYAAFANISASDSAGILARVISDMNQSLGLYAESIELKAKTPLTVRYEDFKKMITDFSVVCMNTILANFDDASRYKNDGISQSEFTQAQLNLYAEAFIVYKKLNPKSPLITTYGGRINELRDWVGKKPVTGGDLSAKEQQRNDEKVVEQKPIEEKPQELAQDPQEEFDRLQELLTSSYKEYQANPTSFTALKKIDLLNDIQRYESLGKELDEEFEIGRIGKFRIALSIASDSSVDVKSKLAALKQAVERYKQSPSQYIDAEKQKFAEDEYGVRKALLDQLLEYEALAKTMNRSLDTDIVDFKPKLVRDLGDQLKLEKQRYVGKDKETYQNHLGSKILRIQQYTKQAQAIGISPDQEIISFLKELINDNIALMRRQIATLESNKNLFEKDSDLFRIQSSLTDVERYINFLKTHTKEIPSDIEAFKEKLKTALRLRELLNRIREKRKEYKMLRDKTLIPSLIYDLTQYINDAPKIGITEYYLTNYDPEQLVKLKNDLKALAQQP